MLMMYRARYERSHLLKKYSTADGSVIKLATLISAHWLEHVPEAERVRRSDPCGLVMVLWKYRSRQKQEGLEEGLLLCSDCSVCSASGLMQQ